MNTEHAAACARLGIGRTVNDTVQAGVQHGSHAHGARLQRNEQAYTRQTVVFHESGGLPQSDDFGMAAGIVVDDAAVKAQTYYLPLRIQGDGTHRHLRSEEHTSELQSLMRTSYP